jgi:hypothetical protein
MYESPPEISKETKTAGCYYIWRPCLTILAASTDIWLSDNTSESDLKGGFLGRWLFFVSAGPDYKLPRCDPTDAEAEQRLLTGIERLKSVAGEVKLNKFTKALLTATALAPTLIVMAVDYFAHKGLQTWWCFGTQLMLIVIALVTIALFVMAFVRRHGEKMPFSMTKAKNSDKEVLAFLVAYLLPILIEHKILFKDFGITTLAILLLLSIAVYHANAFDFNPLLGMFGFHFYEIEGDGSFPCLLISRRSLKKPAGEITVVQLFDYTFLLVEP